MPVLAVPALNPNHEILERAAFGESLAIAVDNDNFSTTIADVENIIIDNSNMASLLIHLFNNAGTNSFDYEVSGHANYNNGVPPGLNEPARDWFILPSGTGSIANNASAALSVTDDWAWIMIRVKRTTAAQDSVADVRVRGLKN